MTPLVLLRAWCRLSFVQDIVNGEPKFPYRSWFLRYDATASSFYGEMWTQHKETLGDLSAWVSGRTGGPVVLAGTSHDCVWLDDHGPEVEARVREAWEHRAVPGLRLPPYDSYGTVGWSIAAEAASPADDWHDVSGRDPDLAELRYLVAGALGDSLGNPERMCLSFFRPEVQGNQRLLETVTRVLAGADLSDEDEATLAVGVSEKRVHELRLASGYDIWR